MCLGFFSCRSVGRKQGEFANLQAKLHDLVANHEFSGVLLVTQGDATLFSASRGVSNLQQAPIKLKDPFVIGSISKQITAALVLRAYEQQSLALHDPIRRYLPGIAQPWAQKVTIHHLLTHTHGIEDVAKPLRFEVGSRFEYSQLGYELLAQVIESIQGRSFLEVCSDLFASLGLHGSCHPEKSAHAQVVTGFERRDPGGFQPAVDSLKNYAAAGSMISTAKDLARWNDLLHSGQVVSGSTLERMATRYATRQHPIFDEVEYGYGLLFKKSEQDLEIGALGYAPGFASASYYYPKKNMNLVVLSNRVDLSRGFKHAFRVQIEAMRLVKAHQGQMLRT